MGAQQDLGQKIIDFLQTKNDNKEHVIDEVVYGHTQMEILAAIEGLSIADLVHFSNNDPMNWPSFFEERDPAPEPITINYPVVANLIQKEEA